MAKSTKTKKSGKSKKDSAKRGTSAKDQRKGAAPKLSPKAAKKLAKQAERQRAAEAKAAKKAAKAGAASTPAAPDASAPARTGVDEVHVLRLALRDTEARLTETEAALRRAQLELADEREAAADAALAPIEDAIVDAAVAETVAEAVAHAGDADEAALVEQVAEELDAVAAEAETADPDEDHAGEAAAAADAFTGGADSGSASGTDEDAELTPPEPAAEPAEAPNASWTLIRLRAEARSRGLSGISTLSKAALLARLTA